MFWCLSSVFSIVPGANGSLDLLAGRKHNGTNNMAVINNRVLSADPRSFAGVPPGVTFVGGWGAMNRNHLFYEDPAGDGDMCVIGDINGTYNRVTVWDLYGRGLYDVSFGPGPNYNGRGWRRDFYDTRNVRDMAVADLDGDGVKEVVVGLWSGYVLAFDHQLRKNWAVRLPSPPTVLRVLPPSAIGEACILVGSENGTMSLLDHQGQLLKVGKVTGVPTAVRLMAHAPSVVATTS